LTRKEPAVPSPFPTERKFHGFLVTDAGSGTANSVAASACVGNPGQRLSLRTALAIHEVLREAKDVGLRYVDLTTSPDNLASQRVIQRNGGALVEEFVTP